MATPSSPPNADDNPLLQAPQIYHAITSNLPDDNISAPTIPINLDPNAALQHNADAQVPTNRRRASWVAILIFPARIAVGTLSFFAGFSITSSTLQRPLSILSGVAATAAGQLVISLALRRARTRADAELTRAECAQLERMHWLDAIQAVGKIVDRFSHGLGRPRDVTSVRSIFLDVSLARLVHFSTFARRLHIARTRPRTRADVLEAGRHYLDFALATYGFILLRLTGIIHPDYDVMAEGTRGEDVARYMLRLRDEDVVVSHLDGEEINVPRHFVALDRAREAVVVAIRGTNSISDIITDLICANEPFAGGYAHSGMKAAAETLCTSLLPTLRTTMDTYPRYSIVLTGHSMGGGVAILLTRLLLLNGFQAVKCYAFAPCPVFGPMHKVDTEWSDALECFVHADDLVATLCLSSARLIALELERIDKKVPLSVSEKRNIINNGRADVIEDMLNRSRAADPDLREEEVDRLYIPCHRGVHWVIPEDDGDDSSASSSSIALSVDSMDANNGDRDVTTATFGNNDPNSPPQLRGDQRLLSSVGRKQLQRERSERHREWKRKVEAVRGIVPPAYVPMQKCGSYIVRPSMFEKILVTPGCVNSHFPNVYAAAFAGLDLPTREWSPPPARRRKFTTPWYSNELG